MLVLTLTPAQEMPDTPDWKLVAFDTAAHAGVFAVLATLSWVAVRQQRRWPALARQAGLVVLLGCVVFGGLIEVLQYVMALGRHAEWSDLGADSLGAALALLLLGSGWRWWQQRQLATTLLVLLLLGSSLFFACPAQAQAPDLARARRTIEELASPKLHGRGYVQGGEHLAAAYLRGRLKQLGLQPLAPDYTQPFTLDVNTFPGKVSLKIFSPFSPTAPITALAIGTDFIIAPESAGTSGKELTAVAVRFDTACFRSAIHQAALKQQVHDALILTSQLKKGGVPPFLVLTAHDEQRLSSLPSRLKQSLDSLPNRILLAPKLTASVAPESVGSIRIESLDKLEVWKFGGQHQRLITLTLQLDAELKHSYQTQNLAAVIRGKAQPDSFLVVSAHYDHLGMMGKDTYFPGANDNASGVALLLELAAYYARPENQPAYSVVFLLFGAEEAGLVGSQYFVAHPLVPLPRIKFLVNLDLLGTGEEGATVVNGKVFESAFQRLTALNDAHHYLPRLGARGKAANSDHFPFSEAGVPAFFLYTRGGSTAYHDVNDQPTALSLAGFAGAFGLVRDFLNAQ